MTTFVFLFYIINLLQTKYNNNNEINNNKIRNFYHFN